MQSRISMPAIQPPLWIEERAIDCCVDPSDAAAVMWLSEQADLFAPHPFELSERTLARVCGGTRYSTRRLIRALELVGSMTVVDREGSCGVRRVRMRRPESSE